MEHIFSKLNGFFCLLCLCIPITNVYAQDTNYIKANITVDSWENPKFNDAVVRYTDIFSNESKADTTKKGLCIVKLNLNTTYLIAVSHPEFYTKSIEVETDVPRKQLHKSHTLFLEIILKKNCDENPAKVELTPDPIGRVKFNRGDKEFQYDYEFTYLMEAKYEEERKLRCRIAEELRKEAKRQEEERLKALKLAEKMASEKAERDRLLAEKARIDSIQMATAKQESDRLAMIEQKRLEREAEEKRIKEENEKFRQERAAREAEERRLAEERKQAKKREPRFDETKEFIFIYPKHGWPSALANSILEPGSEIGPIGTFTYT
nr:hypothetical protein [Bacteroidota bacterium]